jgi:hypothetical protein
MSDRFISKFYLFTTISFIVSTVCRQIFRVGTEGTQIDEINLR